MKLLAKDLPAALAADPSITYELVDEGGRSIGVFLAGQMPGEDMTLEQALIVFGADEKLQNELAELRRDSADADLRYQRLHDEATAYMQTCVDLRAKWSTAETERDRLRAVLGALVDALPLCDASVLGPEREGCIRTARWERPHNPHDGAHYFCNAHKRFDDDELQWADEVAAAEAALGRGAR